MFVFQGSTRPHPHCVQQSQHHFLQSWSFDETEKYALQIPRSAKPGAKEYPSPIASLVPNRATIKASPNASPMRLGEFWEPRTFLEKGPRKAESPEKSRLPLAGATGLEPATYGFGDRCSTN